MMAGKAEGLPYSLSRWTDVPAAKWAWFLAAMRDGGMVAFDPRTAVPGVWSLRPEDTAGLIFWTKDPSNLVESRALLREYRVTVHVTVTGWVEVERGAPTLREGADGLGFAVDAFGAENVTWRFSPVPDVPDVVERFAQILVLAERRGVRSVYASFLQTNDLLPETRDAEARVQVLEQMAGEAARHGVEVRLCAEDRLLVGRSGLPSNLGPGVCAPPEAGVEAPSEGCGCVLMVDPFTVNESCTMGCGYCYAADRTLAERKRNTTRRLPVVRG
jgi:hypothetical protein